MYTDRLLFIFILAQFHYACCFHRELQSCLMTARQSSLSFCFIHFKCFSHCHFFHSIERVKTVRCYASKFGIHIYMCGGWNWVTILNECLMSRERNGEKYSEGGQLWRLSTLTPIYTRIGLFFGYTYICEVKLNWIKWGEKRNINIYRFSFQCYTFYLSHFSPCGEFHTQHCYCSPFYSF